MSHHQHNTRKHSSFSLALTLLILLGLLSPSGMGIARADNAPTLVAPQLLSPKDDSFPTFTPTFKWTAVGGIDKYRLEYTTDPTCSFGAGSTSYVETVNTEYTPTVSFPNDINICWRVQTRAGLETSPYSSTWSFIKRWYIQPQPLTPVNGYQYVRDPLLSWAPVPGAARYKVEVSPENSFPPKSPGWTEYTANTFDWKQDEAVDGVWYWRVTPVDYSNNEGKPSVVSSFHSVHPNAAYYPAPQLIYPLYYYPARDDVNPREDRTIATPIFMWHRTLMDFEQNQVPAYRLQVDDNESFNSIDWKVDTANLSVSPTADHPFTPADDGRIYYWRVCALDAIGGSCLTDPDNYAPLWSEIWRTRIDTNLAATATINAAPTLLRPELGFEAVETTPQFEWLPFSGASKYKVQIAIDPGFQAQNIVDENTVPYTAYTPLKSLDYYPSDASSDLPYGTYYWRVRGFDSHGNPVSSWSATWRFQIAAQSHWLYARTAGNPNNLWKVATDKDDVANDGYELTNLYVSQSSSNWHFGFPGSPLSPDRTYGIYIDLDHEDNVGADRDPRGNKIATISPHRPEYAIYVTEGSRPFPFTADNVRVYHWNGASWDISQSLLNLGGDIFPNKIYAVAASAPDLQYAMGKYGVMLQGDGSEWSLLESPTPNAIHDISVNESAGLRYAVGESGTILYWNESAKAWRQSDIYFSGNFYGVDVGSGSIFVAGEKGNIYYWNGISWSKATFENTSFTYDVYSIDMQSGSDGWAVGQSGKILHWGPIGYINKWQEVSSPTTANLRSVFNVSDTESWAVGDSGTILHRTDSNWAAVSSPTTQHLQSVSMVSATDGWAVGLNGVILRWNGSSWSTFTSPTTHHLYDVDMYAADDGWIVGDSGTNLHWDGSTWTPVQDPIANYIELMVPSTVIGMEANTGSAAVSLFSVNETTGLIQDTVPTGDPDVLNRFASVSERMTLAYPPTNATGDPTTYPSVLPFFWHWPTVVPWEGYRLEVALDELFTSPIYSEEVITNPPNPPYLAAAFHTPELDFNGDNTYYWRVRPQYYHSTSSINPGGAWSQPGRFEREGYVPQNADVTFNGSAPVFNWDMAEGAMAYELEVDDDPNFGNPNIKATTPQTSYTPIVTLPDGTYHWRVRVLRYGTSAYQPIKGDWSQGMLVIGNSEWIYLPLTVKGK